MNFIFLLIGLLLVIVLFQIFRSSEILGVATKKVSKSFEDSNNRYNAILGVIFLIGLIFLNPLLVISRLYLHVIFHLFCDVLPLIVEFLDALIAKANK